MKSLLLRRNHFTSHWYISILIWRSSSWPKEWSNDNCNLLRSAIGKWSTEYVAHCMFVLNTPKCLQQNKIFKLLQRKCSGFWVTCLDCAMNGAFRSLGSSWPSTSRLREDGCKSHPARLCQHPPSSNGLGGSPHTWQRLQDHVGSCLSTFRI